MFSTCMFCNAKFDTEEQESVCDHCSGVVAKALYKRGKLKERIISTLLEDKEFIRSFAIKMFHSVQAVDIGLGGPGSLAQNFRKKRKRKTKKKTS